MRGHQPRSDAARRVGRGHDVEHGLEGEQQRQQRDAAGQRVPEEPAARREAGGAGARLEAGEQATGEGLLAPVEQLLDEERVGVHRGKDARQTTRDAAREDSPQEEGGGPAVVEAGALLVPVPVHVQHGVAPPVPRLEDGRDGVGERVEGLAGVAQPEEAELVHVALHVVESTVQRKR